MESFYIRSWYTLCSNTVYHITVLVLGLAIFSEPEGFGLQCLEFLIADLKTVGCITLCPLGVGPPVEEHRTKSPETPISLN